MSRTTRTVLAPRVFALADDLSGAAEVAAALGLRGRIVLGPATAPPRDGESVVLDLDTRQSAPQDAASAVRAALAYADGGVVLKKIDSLLRGNLAAEAAAYATGARGVVIAPALPVAGRTVREGVVNLHGTALHTTDAWRAERGAAPESVGAALGGVPTRVVPLATVRAPAPALYDRLRALVAEGYHPVCDAETDTDLDAISEAALQLGPGIRLMGTGGLAAALGRRLARAETGAGRGRRELTVTVIPWRRTRTVPRSPCGIVPRQPTWTAQAGRTRQVRPVLPEPTTCHRPSAAPPPDPCWWWSAPPNPPLLRRSRNSSRPVRTTYRCPRTPSPTAPPCRP
ncbi:four-carbon acid sugar kinase family protein [Streptomyces sp. GLT-R25]